MNYKIYTQTKEGLHLEAITNDWRTVSAYKACCSNVTVVDTANDLPLDIDTVTCEQYGVSDESTMYSALVFCACVVLASVLIIVALLTNS